VTNEIETACMLREAKRNRVRARHRGSPNNSSRRTLIAPEACEAHGGAEFPRFGLLLAGDGEGTSEIRLCLRCITLGQHQRDFAGNAINLGLEPCFFGGFSCGNGFADAAPSVVELPKVRIGFGQI